MSMRSNSPLTGLQTDRTILHDIQTDHNEEPRTKPRRGAASGVTEFSIFSGCFNYSKISNCFGGILSKHIPPCIKRKVVIGFSYKKSGRRRYRQCFLLDKSCRKMHMIFSTLLRQQRKSDEMTYFGHAVYYKAGSPFSPYPAKPHTTGVPLGNSSTSYHRCTLGQ
jgi:hypothetical protein